MSRIARVSLVAEVGKEEHVAITPAEIRKHRYITDVIITTRPALIHADTGNLVFLLPDVTQDNVAK